MLTGQLCTRWKVLPHIKQGDVCCKMWESWTPLATLPRVSFLVIQLVMVQGGGGAEGGGGLGEGETIAPHATEHAMIGKVRSYVLSVA